MQDNKLFLRNNKLLLFHSKQQPFSYFPYTRQQTFPSKQQTFTFPFETTTFFLFSRARQQTFSSKQQTFTFPFETTTFFLFSMQDNKLFLLNNKLSLFHSKQQQPFSY